MSDGMPAEERRTDEGVSFDLSKGERASAERATRWPRRNSQGRITEFRHLLEVVLVLLVFGLVAVVVVDAIAAWVGFSELGQTSGWLAGVMVFWMYVEEFRAWRGARSRWLVGLAAGVVAVGVGAMIAALLSWLLPPLASGAVGVAISGFGYAPLWFFGIRRAVDREAGG